MTIYEALSELRTFLADPKTLSWKTIKAATVIGEYVGATAGEIFRRFGIMKASAMDAEKAAEVFAYTAACDESAIDKDNLRDAWDFTVEQMQPLSSE